MLAMQGIIKRSVLILVSLFCGCGAFGVRLLVPKHPHPLEPSQRGSNKHEPLLSSPSRRRCRPRRCRGCRATTRVPAAHDNQQHFDVTQLLALLDANHVRYPPRATRQDLQTLWQQKQQQQQQQQQQQNHSLTETDDTNHASIMEPPPQQPQQQLHKDNEKHRACPLSLPALLQYLDQRHIRYTPRASRQELEQLWRQYHQHHPQQQQQQQQQERSRESSPSPLVKLQQTQQPNEKEKEPRRPKRFEETTTTTTTTIHPNNYQHVPKQQRQSTRGHKSSPPPTTTTATATATATTTATATATRSTNHNNNNNQQCPSPPSSQQQQQNNKDVVTQTTQYVTRKAKQVSRQAREWWTVDQDGVWNANFYYISKNNNNNNHSNDNDDDRVIEVQAQRIPRRRRRPPPRNNKQPPRINNNSKEPTWTTRPVGDNKNVQESSATPTAATVFQKQASAKQNLGRDGANPTTTTTTTTTSSKRPQRAQRRSSRPTTFTTRQAVSSSSSSSPSPTWAARSNLWSTPLSRQNDSSSSSNNNNNSNTAMPLALRQTGQTLPPRPKASSNNNNNNKHRRQVYSPYVTQAGFRHCDNDENENDYRDTLDRLGEYLADVADRIMWGKLDDPQGQGRPHNPRGPPGTTPTTTTSSSAAASSRPNESSWTTTPTSPPSPRRTHSRHWKDRMEERIDAMLGIHQNGKYYDSWMSQDHDNARQVQGTDAFSYARGRARSQVYGKPFWEEEGTLWTLLFGKASPGKKLQFRHAIDGEPGQLLAVFKILLRTGLAGAGYACRWASVRGSIPQPLVVLSICTAALCTHRHRLRTVLVVLLALRTLGELIHSYVLGDEGWDCHQDVDEQQDLESDEKGGARVPNYCI